MRLLTVMFYLSDAENPNKTFPRFGLMFEKIDLIENAELGFCSLIKAAKSVIDKLDLINITQTQITGKERKEKRLVDVVALREAVLNAMIHNDYMTEIPPLVETFSDRIVITSSGGLPQALTPNEFFSGISAPRNKELMRIFKDLKLAEQIGSGMRRILNIYDKSIFEISENFLRVTFYYDMKMTSNVTNNVTKNVTKNVINNVTNNGDLNSTQQKIVDVIGHNKNVTTTELTSILGITKRQVLRNIKKLTDMEIITRAGTRKAGSWLVNDTTLTPTNAKREFLDEIASLAKQLQILYKKISKMRDDGLITQEQYEEMMQKTE